METVAGDLLMTKTHRRPAQETQKRPAFTEWKTDMPQTLKARKGAEVTEVQKWQKFINFINAAVISSSFGVTCLSYILATNPQYTTTTILWPFFRDHPGETVPEDNFWTLWCKGRLTEADTPTIRLGATKSGLTSAKVQKWQKFRNDRSSSISLMLQW